MHLDDDRIDGLFRAVNPAPVSAPDRPLTAAEAAVRESIIRGTHARARRPRRGRLAWAGLPIAAAAVAVTAIVVVNVLSPSMQATAMAPPPLHYTEAGSLDEVVEDAQDALLAPPDVAQASHVSWVSWGWSVDMSNATVEIVPQDVTVDWAPGETATTIILAGDSFWTKDERPEGIDPSPYSPGEVIDRLEAPADDLWMPADAAALSGSSPAELDTALAPFGATDASSSGELLSAITSLQQFWTLSDPQQATLLQMLVDAGGLSVRGETTDRLGRDVIGVTVASVIPERVDTFFLSTENGRIVGVESELIEPIDGLPRGVISYTMWDAVSR